MADSSPYDAGRGPVRYPRRHAEQVRLGIEHRLPGVEVLIPEFWSEVPL